MARTIGTLCTLIVCLQILIGVPIVVCLGCLLVAGNLGPIAVQVHTGQHHALIAPPPYSASFSTDPTIPPPPNIIPQQVAMTNENPVLASRAEHGSPLSGTVLGEKLSPDAEQQMFIAALEKVASEKPLAETAGANSQAREVSSHHRLPQEATQVAIDRLYELAEADERAGDYAKADHWRTLARELTEQD
jgi:hypothetical protein